MELWDAYDKDLNIVNDISLVKGKPIPEGLFHLVCDILVKHIDGTYLLMQRDTKKSYGGMWEATAGGSALRGETSLDCAFRELYEETGIKADKLEEIGRDSNSNTIYVEFLCVTDCEKDSIKLQPGETMAYKWVNRSELMSLNAENLITERIPKQVLKL